MPGKNKRSYPPRWKDVEAGSSSLVQDSARYAIQHPSNDSHRAAPPSLNEVPMQELRAELARREITAPDISLASNPGPSEVEGQPAIVGSMGIDQPDPDPLMDQVAELIRAMQLRIGQGERYRKNRNSHAETLELRRRHVQGDEPDLPDTQNDEVTLHAIVRDYTRLVMKVRREKAPSGNGWLYSPLPGPPDDPSIDPVGTEGFTLAWRDKVRCRYNSIAAQNFATSMLSHETYGKFVSEEERTKISKSFLTHAEHLYDIYNKQTNPPTAMESFQGQMRSRITRRKNTLYRIQKSEAAHWGNAEIMCIVDALGTAGMSSDEDMDENESYAIISKSNWRPAKITHLLRLLELGHKRRNLLKPGKPFRTRTSQPNDNRISARQPPSRLPRNCYKDEYIKSLLPFDRDVLDPADVVEFDIPAAVKELMAASDSFGFS